MIFESAVLVAFGILLLAVFYILFFMNGKSRTASMRRAGRVVAVTVVAGAILLLVFLGYMAYG